VNKGETQLRDMINVALRVIIDGGRMERMARKYSADYMAPRKNFESNQK
jgi:ABC-type amino acid transport substrate-binding protein